MSIYKYNILNPVTNKHKPHYVEKCNWFIFPTTKRYKYYIEVRNGNLKAIRDEFGRGGIRCLGEPTAIVPTPVGAEAIGRIAS